MNTVRFVKSFSRGQITIPKAFRDAFGIKEEFWLKLSLAEGKMIAELVEKENDKKEYAKNLLSVKGEWLSEKEIEENRAEVEKRMQRYSSINK